MMIQSEIAWAMVVKQNNNDDNSAEISILHSHKIQNTD